MDLGAAPLSNAFLREEDLDGMEPFYPLHARVCDSCLLVQVGEFEPPERIFCDYAYFSSYSDSWLAHCRDYVSMACGRFPLGPASRVVEIASNDGCLLQSFIERGIPVLGIEPAANVAAAAVSRGVPTQTRFFGAATAAALLADGYAADLLLGNNVLAHVPRLNDFVEGLRILLKPAGAVTMEFPHLMRLIERNQFDTIYHEHFSYFSFMTVRGVFARHGLTIFDVEELPTHGGSLRIFARHAAAGEPAVGERVARLLGRERDAGLDRPATYDGFAEKAQAVKRDLLSFLIRVRAEGKTVAGYGAPAKGNTLLNYCGIRTDFLDYTVDRSPEKQGRYLPGTRIPVRAPDEIRRTRPDYVLILPWNIEEEIVRSHGYIREWGGRFVVPIPRLRVLA